VLDRTPVQQLAALEALPITTTATVRRGRLRWVGRLQPTPLSVTYTVSIEHSRGKQPQIAVLEPELERPEDGELPHVFAGDRLCLCYPWQWDGSKLIIRTIVPWISEWLLHYEIWKVTGKWHGGGHGTVGTGTVSP
jgi:hypothetical protein